MKRWCISPVLTAPGPLGLPEYRAAVGDVPGLGHVAVIATNPDGTLARGWCLALAAGPPAALQAAGQLPGVRPLPAIGKDQTLRETTAARRAALRALLDDLGLADIQPDPDWPLRAVLRAIGRRLRAEFDEDRDDVSE